MEKLIILIWFKRFDTVNKGLIRLLAVAAVIGSLLMGWFIAEINYYRHGLFDFIIGTIITHISIILLFRISVWVYDGIVGNE